MDFYELDEAALGPRQMLVRSDYTAISPGTEGANFTAREPDVWKTGRWCSYPWKPGYAGVGEVVAIGRSVTEYQSGDLVVGQMRHGSLWLVEDVLQAVAKRDPAVKPEWAAYTPIIGIAMTALQVVRSEPFGTAAVWGLGTIGNFSAQLLSRSGWRVAGIDPLPSRRELAGRCGISETWDPGDPNLSERIAEFTRGTGLGLAVDTTGHAPTTASLPTHLMRRGQLVLLTHWRDQPAIDMTAFVNTIFVKGLTIHGAHASAPGSEAGSDFHALQRLKWTRIQEQIAVGGLNVAPLISHVIKPEHVNEAYNGLCFDPAVWSGVLVDWRESV